MDIGTAKPRAHELAAVPHHLIDIRDPLHAYNAAEFARDAAALIRAISARGKLPLLVGGTMLYFKALFEPLDAMPAADPAIRAAIAVRHGVTVRDVLLTPAGAIPRTSSGKIGRTACRSAYLDGSLRAGKVANAFPEAE